MLSQTLHTLERDGFVTRTVVAAMPPHVEYRLTALGTATAVRLLDLIEHLQCPRSWRPSTATTVRSWSPKSYPVLPTGTCCTLRWRVLGGLEFEVVECGDAGDGMVDRGTAAAAPAEYPVVFAAGDGGAASAEASVVPVLDDVTVGPAAR
jgi:hypothetical protein